MGRYFNDDMIEDQNDDYDAYLEHYGIPKEKWDATVRARFDQLHHKTEDSLRKAKLHANSIGKQAYRSISDVGHNVTKGINKAGRTIKRGLGLDEEYNRKQAAKIQREKAARVAAKKKEWDEWTNKQTSGMAKTAEKAAKLNDDYYKLPKSYRNKKSLELSNKLADKETKELNKVRRKTRR